MGERYLIDSNAIIDYFGELMPEKGLTFLDTIFDSDNIIVSVITHIEVLGFQAPESYLQKIQDLIDLAEVIPLVDSSVIEQAIVIRRKTKIKLPDAVIAATALTHDLTVVSRNEKDFSRIEGLNYINPHTL